MSNTFITFTTSDATIAIIINGGVAILTVLTWYILHRMNAMRNKMSRFAFTLNIFTQFFVVLGTCIAGYSIPNSVNQRRGNAVYNFGNFLQSLLILVLIFVDLELLGIYLTLDNVKINKKRLILNLRIIWPIFFVVTQIGNIGALWMMSFGNMDWNNIAWYWQLYSEYGDLLFSLMAVVYDNLQFFYLARLIYRWKVIKSNKSADSLKELKNIILICSCAVCLDWIAVILDLVNFSAHVASLINCITAISGAHVSIMYIAITRLNFLAAGKNKNKKEEVAEVDTNGDPVSYQTGMRE